MLDALQLGEVTLVELLTERVVFLLVESQILLLWDGNLRTLFRVRS